jgi:hypothetical protein
MLNAKMIHAARKRRGGGSESSSGTLRLESTDDILDCRDLLVQVCEFGCMRQYCQSVAYANVLHFLSAI